MKQQIKNIANHWRALMGLLVVVGSLFLHACQDDEQMKWVDLRYKAQDAYTLEALNPAPFMIQVMSTDPWEVYSKHSDWCTIAPAKGEAGEIFDVEIAYTDNNQLDDRVDTITIKSDYWIGIEVTVTQKGTAYLILENSEDFVLDESGGNRTFAIRSNQDWRTAVTEGEEWMSIASGATGTLNGEVTVQCMENRGEMRIGTIAVYDRHNVVRGTVRVVQNGLQLDIEQTLFKVYHQAQTLTIPVTSNAEWLVSKDDADAEWYSFEKTTFNGSEVLVVELQENPGGNVRKASFTLATVAQADGKPIVSKTITVKQANNVIPTVHEFDETEKTRWTLNNGVVTFANNDITCTVGRITQANFEAGYYEFRIKSMTADAQSTLFFTYGTQEIRWHLNMASGKTNFTTTPGTTANNSNQAFDKSKGSYTLGLNLLKADNGKYKIEWSLDGVLLYTYDGTESFDVDYGTKSFTFLGCSAGTVVYDWWSYSTPIDWGDE